MAEPMTPEVAELVERVSARVARAATADEIRALTSKAARDSAMGIGEIRDLMNVAIDRARQVEALASRLADLVSEARDGT